MWYFPYFILKYFNMLIWRPSKIYRYKVNFDGLIIGYQMKKDRTTTGITRSADITLYLAIESYFSFVSSVVRVRNNLS